MMKLVVLVVEVVVVVFCGGGDCVVTDDSCGGISDYVCDFGGSAIVNKGHKYNSSKFFL